MKINSQVCRGCPSYRRGFGKRSKPTCGLHFFNTFKNSESVAEDCPRLAERFLLGRAKDSKTLFLAK